MIVSTISFWLPLIWAIFTTLAWRFTWKHPVNHWIICLLIGAVSFFFFATTIIAYLVFWVIKSDALKSLKSNYDKEDESKGK